MNCTSWSSREVLWLTPSGLFREQNSPGSGERHALLGGGAFPTRELDPALARAQGPLTPRLPATSSTQWCDVTRRAANENAVYWQAARAVAAKKEVSWGCSDGGGLEPTAASAATSTSGTAAAAAGSGAGVAAGVEKERVSRRCRNTSNSGREVFR